MTEPQIMVCAVCHRVLDYYEALDPQGHSHWQHTVQDQVSQDHEPVPVPATRANTYVRCDFCNTDIGPGETEWTIPVKTFEMPLTPGKPKSFPAQMSEGDWAACGSCEPLITERRWYDLIQRIRRVGGNRLGPVERRMLMTMYQKLDANITGPARPIVK